MKNVRTLMVLVSLIMGIGMLESIKADTLNSPTKIWKIGDSWKVHRWSWYIPAEVLPAASKKIDEESLKPRKYETTMIFEVKGIVSTADFDVPYEPSNLQERTKEKYRNMPKEGYPCYEVAVIFPEENTGFKRRYLLYYRINTGNLIRVLNSSIRQDDSVMSSKTDYPIDPDGPNLDADRECYTFGFPDFRVKK